VLAVPKLDARRMLPVGLLALIGSLSAASAGGILAHPPL
jgi:hypothetical protein